MSLKKSLLIVSISLLASCDRKPATHSGPFLIRDGVTYDQKTNEPVTGIIANYHESGELSEMITLVAGRRKGLYEAYFPDGTILLRVTYKVSDEGMTSRYAEKYHHDGSLSEKTLYKDGKKNGLTESYYESGQLFRRQTFVNGKKKGLSETYHPNGQLKQSAVFKDGEEDGEQKSYSIGGHLTVTAMFKKGIKQGVSKEYFPNGSLRSKKKYVNGYLSGFSEVYFRGGEVSEKTIYDSNGCPVSVKKFDKSGREIGDGKVFAFDMFDTGNPCY